MGALAGVICAIHCALTPFLLGVFPLLREAGGLWGVLDIAFLLVSLFAVWGTVRGNGLDWVRYVGPTGWVVLALRLIADRTGMVGGDYLMYLGGAVLVMAHIANIRYCRQDRYRSISF